MRKFLGFAVAAALYIAVLEALAVAQAASAAQAGPVAPCDMRLRVELTPDVPDPLDTGFVSSLLGNHPDYRLTLERRDPEDSSVIALELTGPGPEAGCREVVTSMRKDARVTSVEVQRDTANIGLTRNTAQPLRGVPPVAAGARQTSRLLARRGQLFREPRLPHEVTPGPRGIRRSMPDYCA